MAASSDYSAVIRALWPQSKADEALFGSDWLLAMMKKVEDFDYEPLNIVVKYARPQSRSADFATAQSLAAASASKFKGFAVYMAENFAVGTVPGKIIAQGRKNRALLVREFKDTIDGLMDETANSISHDLWRDGTGVRGQAASSSAISTVTLTLADPADALNFEPGMEVVLAATKTGAIRSGSATITAIDPEAGTLVTDSNWTSQISGATNDDYIFAKGDAANNTGTSAVITGVGGWNPITKPGGSDSFWGVNRSAYAERLSGNRYDGSGDADIKTAITKGITKISRMTGNKAKPKFVALHDDDLESLLVDLQGDRTYEKVDVPGANVSFDAVTFSGRGTGGRLFVMPTKYMTKGYARIIDPASWEFHHIDPVPHIIQDDGNKALRQTSADGVEIRVAARGNVVNRAPLHNCVVTLP